MLAMRLVQIVAAAGLFLVLWSLFRLAMGLRFAKVSREEARRVEETRGRRVVAEIALDEGLVLFLEDDQGFYWGANRVRKSEIAGARLLLNCGVLGACARPGVVLPEPIPPEEFEGRERWEVVLYGADGSVQPVHCGTLREGVSREIAGKVFAAVREGFVADQPLHLTKRPS